MTIVMMKENVCTLLSLLHGLDIDEAWGAACDVPGRGTNVPGTQVVEYCTIVPGTEVAGYCTVLTQVLLFTYRALRFLV